MRHTEAYVADLENTLSQLATILGSPLANPEALLYRARYVAAAARAVGNVIAKDGVRRAFERMHDGNFSYSVDPVEVFARDDSGAYVSKSLQHGWAFFNATMLASLNTLANPLTTSAHAAECVRVMGMALNIPEAESTFDTVLCELSK